MQTDPLSTLSAAVLHVAGAEALDRDTIMDALSAAVQEIARLRQWNTGLGEVLAGEISARAVPADPARIAADLDEQKAANGALSRENQRLRAMTQMGLGVGDGNGNLFVHGSPDAINHVRALLRRLDQLERVAAAGGRPN